MIDINELRRLAQAASSGPDGVSLNWIKPLQDFQQKISPAVVSELLDRLEAAEKDVAIKEEVIDSLAAVIKRLDAQCGAAEKERDTYKAAYSEWIAKTEWVQDELTSGKLPAKYLGMHRADGIKVEINALRAKIAEMEKQEPFDADHPEFRRAFDAALKTGNWPTERKNFGYRSPMSQIAWQVAFCTVNNLKLYALPGAKGEEKRNESYRQR